jgi:hypothetical protein
MEENCVCNNCREEKIRNIIGKLPIQERYLVGKYLSETNGSEFMRGIYLACLMGLLIVLGFIGGLAIFL